MNILLVLPKAVLTTWLSDWLLFTWKVLLGFNCILGLLYIVNRGVIEPISICFNGVSHQLNLSLLLLQDITFAKAVDWLNSIVVYILRLILDIIWTLFSRPVEIPFVYLRLFSVVLGSAWILFPVFFSGVCSLSFNLIIVLIVSLDAFLKVIDIYFFLILLFLITLLFLLNIFFAVLYASLVHRLRLLWIMIWFLLRALYWYYFLFIYFNFMPSFGESLFMLILLWALKSIRRTSIFLAIKLEDRLWQEIVLILLFSLRLGLMVVFFFVWLGRLFNNIGGRLYTMQLFA